MMKGDHGPTKVLHALTCGEYCTIETGIYSPVTDISYNT